jgi:hypothetical protein
MTFESHHKVRHHKSWQELTSLSHTHKQRNACNVLCTVPERWCAGRTVKTESPLFFPPPVGGCPAHVAFKQVPFRETKRMTRHVRHHLPCSSSAKRGQRTEALATMTTRSTTASRSHTINDHQRPAVFNVSSFFTPNWQSNKSLRASNSVSRSQACCLP